MFSTPCNHFFLIISVKRRRSFFGSLTPLISLSGKFRWTCEEALSPRQFFRVLPLIFLSSPLDTPSSLAYFSDMFLGRQERTRLRQAFPVAAQCPLAGRSIRPHSFPFFRFRDKWPPFTKHLETQALRYDENVAEEQRGPR